jgi:hypothetical protein
LYDIQKVLRPDFLERLGRLGSERREALDEGLRLVLDLQAGLSGQASLSGSSRSASKALSINSTLPFEPRLEAETVVQALGVSPAKPGVSLTETNQRPMDRDLLLRGASV